MAKLKADDIREHLEHADNLGRVQPMRFRINGAKRPEKRTIGQTNGHRNIALKSIERRGMVTGVSGAFGHVIDNDGLAAPSDFMAQGRFNLKLISGL